MSQNNGANTCITNATIGFALDDTHDVQNQVEKKRPRRRGRSCHFETKNSRRFTFSRTVWSGKIRNDKRARTFCVFFLLNTYSHLARGLRTTGSESAMVAIACTRWFFHTHTRTPCSWKRLRMHDIFKFKRRPVQRTNSRKRHLRKKIVADVAFMYHTVDQGDHTVRGSFRLSDQTCSRCRRKHQSAEYAFAIKCFNWLFEHGDNIYVEPNLCQSTLENALHVNIQQYRLSSGQNLQMISNISHGNIRYVISSSMKIIYYIFRLC